MELLEEGIGDKAWKRSIYPAYSGASVPTPVLKANKMKNDWGREGRSKEMNKWSLEERG